MSKYKRILKKDDEDGDILDMDGDYKTEAKRAVFVDKDYQGSQTDNFATISKESHSFLFPKIK